MKETFEITNATVKNILSNIKKEIRDLAKIYDSRDLFGLGYVKYTEKIIDVIETYEQ